MPVTRKVLPLVLLLCIMASVLGVAAPAHADVAVWGPKANGANHKCLDAESHALWNGDKVQVWDCWPGYNQFWGWDCQWWQSPEITGCQIKNLATGTCLDAESHNVTVNGDRVQIWECWGGANQIWTVGYPDRTQPGYFQLINAASGKCLDAESHNITANGDIVQLWDCWYTGEITIGGIGYKIPAPNQTWSY